MKRILALIMILTVSLSALVGCKKDTEGAEAPPISDDGSFKIPEYLSGTDVIKLLLASKRLDSTLLKTEGDIFENGSEVMQTLGERALSNLPSKALAETSEAPRGGKLEVDGDRFVWSDLKENCNSYDYFENITQNIVNTAENGANLIDDTKKHVRIIDKWVAIGSSQYYLSVDEDSETIFYREDGIVRICKRHKNASGENVYEMYYSGSGYESRMLYIPGMRYEWSEIDPSGFGTFFVADNSKGYWETLVIGEAPEHYNVSCFVMKKDICYDAIYSPEFEEISLLKTMSSDRSSDIFFFSGSGSYSFITLNLGAFDGISSIEITAPADKVASSFDNCTDTTTVIYSTDNEIYAATTGVESATLNLENGKKIEYGASYANGTVSAGGINVLYGSEIYTSQLEINVSGDSGEEKLANLSLFLEESGLVCRHDISTVLSGVSRAQTEVDSFIDYYRWNKQSIKTTEGISSAVSKEEEKIGALYETYTAIKDAEIIDFTDKETVELNIDFSSVTMTSAGSASLENMRAEILGLVLTVEDTTLFVENSSYTVNFALIKDGGSIADIVHIPTDSPTETVYTGSDTFTLGTAHASLDIPVLTEGKYTLVAYVATSDKIRASQYIPVIFEKINTETVHLSGSVLVVEKKEDSSALLSYLPDRNVTVELTLGEVLGYFELLEILKECAGTHGVISSDALEIYDAENDTFIPVSDSEAPLISGIYRIAYDVTDGENTFNGYAHAEYTAPNLK